MILGQQEGRRPMRGEERADSGDMRSWMDKQRRMEEAIPPVAAETVRGAAITVVERYGVEGAEILAMLGIDAHSLLHGTGSGTSVAVAS